MYKIYRILIILIFITILPFSVNAHVQHYKDLKRIEFDIYRNNKHIGEHIFSFAKSNEQISIESKINFIIKNLASFFISMM